MGSRRLSIDGAQASGARCRTVFPNSKRVQLAGVPQVPRAEIERLGRLPLGPEDPEARRPLTSVERFRLCSEGATPWTPWLLLSVTAVGHRQSRGVCCLYDSRGLSSAPWSREQCIGRCVWDAWIAVYGEHGVCARSCRGFIGRGCAQSCATAARRWSGAGVRSASRWACFRRWRSRRGMRGNGRRPTRVELSAVGRSACGRLPRDRSG